MEEQIKTAEAPPVPTLADVLADETLSVELYDHAKRTYTQETIDFYRAVENYQYDRIRSSRSWPLSLLAISFAAFPNLSLVHNLYYL